MTTNVPATPAALTGTTPAIARPRTGDHDQAPAPVLPQLWSIDVIDDFGPPLPVLQVDDAVDLDTPARLRAAADQYRALADRLDGIATEQDDDGPDPVTPCFSWCQHPTGDPAYNGIHESVRVELPIPAETSTGTPLDVRGGQLLAVQIGVDDNYKDRPEVLIYHGGNVVGLDQAAAEEFAGRLIDFAVQVSRMGSLTTDTRPDDAGSETDR